MQRVDLNTSGDRKKLIIAVVLGLVAIVFLWWTFFGFGSSTPPKAGGTQTQPPPPASRQPSQQVRTPVAIKDDPLNQLREVPPVQIIPVVSEPKRNIFAFYEPPPTPSPVVEESPSTPAPTPPVLLASISPANVYARTGDFTLEAAGDKFSPNLRVTVDGRELSTRYSGPQQMSATVPAAIIATPGQRQIVLRSPDGVVYSNPIMLNVAQPPTPNYTYVGIIGKPTYSDTAILRDSGSREILNVQRGDVLGGRFRVTSISEKELVLTDTNLKIRHTLPFTVDGERSFNPLQRPTPKVDSEDDEP